MQTQALQTNQESKSLSFIDSNQLQKYSEVDNQVTELLNSKLKGIALTYAKITVVEKIEELLSEDFMKKVLNLKNKEYGFKTDEKGSESYSNQKVKTCIVQAMLFGAEITGNEFNILGGNCYLTKNYCKNWLRKHNVAYKLRPSLSKKEENQWVVPMYCEWVDFDGVIHKETIDIPVNKFEKTNEATMRGQAERDAMAFIIEDLTKTSIPLDKNSDYTDVPHEEVGKRFEAKPKYDENVKPVTEKDIEEAIVVENVVVQFESDTNGKVKIENDEQVKTEETKPETKTESKPETNTEQNTTPKVDAQTQAEFDKFISNKQKVTSVQTLTARAKAFCADKGIQTSSLNLSVFNDIKFKIDNNQW